MTKMRQPLARHGSMLHKPKPAELDLWLDQRKTRSLSVPDLHKLRREWDHYQQSDSTPENRIIDTKLQIDLLNIRLYDKIEKPQMRLKMGLAQYYSKRSESSTGDWNEGFVFIISYHAQLFNTIEFDLYDKPHKHWPAARHMGKAKLKISTLAGKSDVFVTFLPIYEYRSKRLLPTDFQSTLLEKDIVDPAILPKRMGDLNLIGSVQIRVRYHFQLPSTDDMPNRQKLILDTSSLSSSEEQANSEPVHYTQPKKKSILDTHPLTTTTSRRTSYGRADLAQDEDYVNNIFKNQLSKIMSAHIPSESSLKPNTIKSTKKRSKWGFHRTGTAKSFRNAKHVNWIHHILSPAKKLPNSSSGRRYGFSQNDSDDNHKFNPDDDDSKDSSSTLNESLSSDAPVTDRLAHGARKKAQHIINSVNFGDKNFASQWMQDSFDDVALSHPLVDKLIGLVVSKQTQAMVRAIIKTANSFGQGFRVTGIKLLKSALLVQKFYETLPKHTESKAITDVQLIDNACHYFGYALVAYGWRGLCYIGAYTTYIRGARDRRSNRLAIVRYLHLNPEDLLGYEFSLRKGASFQPSYFVALDRSRKAIVLSIRGTWSLYDAITDLVCEYKPWKGGLVHSGMLASAQWFYTSIIPQIFRYIHHHNQELTNFVITGHSLGGGTASLLSMMVVDHIDELCDLASNKSFGFHCYSYAPSAVSSINLGKQYDEYITSFVVQDDVVGRLSYGSAMKLRELVLDMISAYRTLGGFRTVMTDPKARVVCFEIISQCRNKLKRKADSLYPSLFIPGKIIHIQRNKKEIMNSDEEDDTIPSVISKTHYSLHYTTREISNEMKLTKSCIEDHMITAYQNAFLGLKEQFDLIKKKSS